MKQLLTLLILGITTSTFSQTLEELYQKRDYKGLIKSADSELLTKEECYFIGYAYFQSEDDRSAIKMYDKAIARGLDEDYIYLYKGLSHFYLKEYNKAIDNYRIAIQRNPLGQKNYTELGNAYYYQDKKDSALVYFYKARALEFELGDPYLKLPNIYHVRGEYDKALEEYYASAALIDKEDPVYIELLKNIGLLEYIHTKDYAKSVKAYSEMLSLIPEEYGLYSKLIKSCYANEDYVKGDSVFNILKTKYERKELPQEMLEVRGIPVDQFEWNGQMVSAMKYYKKPEEFAEPIYQMFLYEKDGEEVEKKFMTEKSMIDIDGIKHLLCATDKRTGSHFTYPIGWKTDDVEYREFKNYVMMILNGDLQPQASSNFGEPSKKKKKKKKKK